MANDTHYYKAAKLLYLLFRNILVYKVNVNENSEDATSI